MSVDIFPHGIIDLKKVKVSCLSPPNYSAAINFVAGQFTSVNQPETKNDNMTPDH